MRLSRYLVVLLSSFYWIGSGQSAAQNTWPPIDPAHLAMKTSRVEPGADAEVLIWRVLIEKDLANPSFTSHLRIKILNERGRDAYSTVDLPFDKDSRIQDVSARTIRPDGSVIDVKPESMIEREIVRGRKTKVKALSFTFPNAEPGAIIDYRWRYELKDAWYLRLDFQREIPIQLVEYSLKLKSLPGIKTSMLPMQMSEIGFRENEKGILSAKLVDVPAFKEEPLMPPEDSVKKWVLVYPETWQDSIGSKVDYAVSVAATKVDDEVKRLSASLIQPTMSDDQKLARFYEYCQTNIKNLSDPGADITRSELARVKQNKNPSETIRRGMGTGPEINALFGALAIAAGYDARITSLAGRHHVLPDSSSENPYFETSFNMAVRVGNTWRFFDPGSPEVSFGMLLWQEEGVKTRIPDPMNLIRINVPVSPPEKSMTARDAKLRLTSEGDLSGEVSYQLTGHVAARLRRSYAKVAPEDRIQALQKSLADATPGLVITNLRIEDFGNTAKPLRYVFDISLPGYAQRTGRRLIVQPAFFHFGEKPDFVSSERRNPVYFSFPWSEKDTAAIELPAGYELEHPEGPAPVTASGLSKYSVDLKIDKGRNILYYAREFDFGQGGTLLFPVKTYKDLKGFFDAIHERDSRTLVLKQLESRETPK